MTTPSSEMPDVLLESRGTAPPLALSTRPFYWSIRRELWENRSLTIAPPIVAAVFLFGYMVSTITLPRRMAALLTQPPAKLHAAVTMPYGFVAMALIVTAFIVGIFYCLDALHGERRDRSILFWKSLPVSDRTTVLAKASIPLVVLPLYTFALMLLSQLVVLTISTLRLVGHGPELAALWSNVPLLKMWVAIFYGMVTIALWHAPIYAWFLLVSAWARRATFIWAMLPLVAINVFERIAFRTSNFCSLLQYRVVGWFKQGFVQVAGGATDADPISMIAPVHFFSTPGVWVGLVLAAVFLALAMRLRRNKEPI